MTYNGSNFLIDSIRDIDISNINEMSRELEHEINKAKNRLKNYDEFSAKKINVNFDEDMWFFKQVIECIPLKFDFFKVRELLTFNSDINVDEFISILKIWVVDNLEEKALSTAYIAFHDVISAIASTNGFNRAFLDEFYNYLKQGVISRGYNNKIYRKTGVKDYVLDIYIRNVSSFLKSYDESYFEFVDSLQDISKKLDIKMKNRKLPAFNAFTEFKIHIEDWYDEVKTKGKRDEMLKFYPLLLWFNLTSIIPMRPSEFCLIRKKDVEAKDGKFYISFPRLKYHRKKEYRSKIKYDTLPITEDLYLMFEEYKNLTSEFKVTERLINYNSYMMCSLEKDFDEDNDVEFNIIELNRLIKLFYKERIYLNKIKTTEELEIMTEEDMQYETIQNELYFDDESYVANRDYILAGDLRHIAIINMMMRGYSKVEIQRVAGHSCDSTQHGYYNHMENWMDIEILKVQKELLKHNMLKNSNGTSDLINPKAIDFVDEYYDRFYVDGLILNEKCSKFIKLEIGYCKDESMPCPTINWKHKGCYRCKHWTITLAEIAGNRDMIEKDLTIMYEETKEKVRFLKSLYALTIEEHNSKEILNSTVEEIKRGIIDIAKLKQMLGVKNEQ